MTDKMNDNLLDILIFIIFIVIYLAGVMVGCKTSEDYNKELICTKFYAQSIDYKVCLNKSIEEIIQEVKLKDDTIQ